MTDNLGFGREKRRQNNIEVLEGKATFRSVLPPVIHKSSIPINWLTIDLRFLSGTFGGRLGA